MGIITTFFSFKGGVGRTMAMANIAVLLARKGKKVLAVDWDLEAPGLDKYFEDCEVDPARNQAGLLGLLEQAARRSDATKEPDWKDYVSRAKMRSSAELDLIFSGKNNNNDDAYARKILRFDWKEFFEKQGGGKFVESLRNQWLLEYDYVFIDSRTGITDAGGICTIQMPDILTLVFTPNAQSLNGVKEVAQRAQAARQKLAYDRMPLLIFPLPARFDSRAEYEQSQEWLKTFSEELDVFYADWLPKDYSRLEVLEKTKLPHVPYFSFGEKLPAEISSLTDPDGLGYVYSKITSLFEDEFKAVDRLLNLSPSGVTARTRKSKVPAWLSYSIVFAGLVVMSAAAAEIGGRAEFGSSELFLLMSVAWAAFAFWLAGMAGKLLKATLPKWSLSALRFSCCVLVFNVAMLWANLTVKINAQGEDINLLSQSKDQLKNQLTVSTARIVHDRELANQEIENVSIARDVAINLNKQNEAKLVTAESKFTSLNEMLRDQTTKAASDKVRAGEELRQQKSQTDQLIAKLEVAEDNAKSLKAEKDKELKRPIHERAIDLAKQIPEIADARFLALKAIADEAYDKAIKQLETVVKQSEERFVRQYRAQAEEFVAKGQYNEASPLYDDALALAADEPNLAEAAYSVFLANAEYDKAEQITRTNFSYRRYDSIEERIIAIFSPYRYSGHIFRLRGQFEEAEANFRIALDGYQNILEFDAKDNDVVQIFDSLIAQTYGSIAMALQGQGRKKLKEAEDTILMALRIESNVPSIQADNLVILADILRLKGWSSDAYEMLNRSLAIYQQIPFNNRDHANVARAYHVQTMVLITLKEVESAIGEIDHALKEFNGMDHAMTYPPLALLLQTRAMAMVSKGDLVEAENDIRRALEINRAAFRPGHPKIAGNLVVLADILMDTGRKLEAASLLQMALDNYLQTYGTEHRDVKQTRRALEGLGQKIDEDEIKLRSLRNEEYQQQRPLMK